MPNSYESCSIGWERVAYGQAASSQLSLQISLVARETVGRQEPPYQISLLASDVK